MKMPQLLLLLLTILVHAAAGFPSREKHASWDDVNVVAHGLLQLGQGLKEHVDKTKAQMRDVNARLKAFNSTVAALERKQQEQDEALKSRGREGEDRTAEDGGVKMAEVKRLAEDIQTRMDRLEEKVDQVLSEPKADSNDSEHTGIPLIQGIVAAQNRRIDQLVEKIRQQQDKMEKQSLHLQALQSKIAQKRVKSHRRRDEETVLRGGEEPSVGKSGSAHDCHDLFVRGQRASGVYTVQPESSQPFKVLCEMTAEGGWTVIQKRLDGSQSFNQMWESYKKGFGSLSGEFWLGLENIHALSQQGQYLLQVEVSDGAEQTQTVRYGVRLDGEDMKFALHLERESSSALQEQIIPTGASGLPFSTADSDNDLAADTNCAERLSGGWWFSSCGESNLNGKYPRRPSLLRRRRPRPQEMFWASSGRQKNPLKTTLMKIAPATVKH